MAHDWRQKAILEEIWIWMVVGDNMEMGKKATAGYRWLPLDWLSLDWVSLAGLITVGFFMID